MLSRLASYLAFQLLSLDPATRLGGAVQFFLYDSMKIFLMLSVIIYGISLLRSFFPPERTRNLLSRKHTYVGNILAALLGIVTPFCSCSAVPVFIGFVESGVPLGVTFSFLVSSPMVNEVALIMLWGLFGWEIAGLYVATGVLVAIVAGLVIGRLHLESQVEEYVYELAARKGPGARGSTEVASWSWRARHAYALDYVKDILRRIWPYVVVAIAIGGFIHGYAPQDFLARYAGRGSWYAVPLAVLVGVPLYSNAAGIIPVVQALMEKGMALGTVLAFMMSVTALSLPEMIILRRVLKPRLIGIFVGILSLSILLVGYLFNAVM